MNRIGRYLIAFIMACSAVTFATLTTAAPAQAANCSVGWSPYGNQQVSNVFISDGTPFRVGPYASCSLISTYPAWSDAKYHCDYYNANGVWWTHLNLTNWNTNGWAKSSDIRSGLPVVTYFC